MSYYIEINEAYKLAIQKIFKAIDDTIYEKHGARSQQINEWERNFTLYDFVFKAIASINPINEQALVRTYLISKDKYNFNKETITLITDLDFKIELYRVSNASTQISKHYGYHFSDLKKMDAETYEEKLIAFIKTLQP